MNTISHNSTFVLSLALLFIAVSGAVNAQGMVIMGDSSAAQDCHRAADTAAVTRMVGNEDIKQCDLALEYGGLKAKDRIATYVNRGILYSANEDYRKAELDYERAAAIPGHGAEVYANKGNLFFVKRDYQSALNNYNKAIEMGMSRVQIAYANRGMVYEAQMQLELAQVDFQKALEISPEWLKAQQLLARVERKIQMRDGEHNGEHNDL